MRKVIMATLAFGFLATQGAYAESKADTAWQNCLDGCWDGPASAKANCDAACNETYRNATGVGSFY